MLNKFAAQLEGDRIYMIWKRNADGIQRDSQVPVHFLWAVRQQSQPGVVVKVNEINSYSKEQLCALIVNWRRASSLPFGGTAVRSRSTGTSGFCAAKERTCGKVKNRDSATIGEVIPPSTGHSAPSRGDFSPPLPQQEQCGRRGALAV